MSHSSYFPGPNPQALYLHTYLHTYMRSYVIYLAFQQMMINTSSNSPTLPYLMYLGTYLDSFQSQLTQPRR